MSAAHTKGAHKYRDLDAVDVELEQALDAIRARAQRLPRGRVIAVIERQDHVTVWHRVEVEQMTERDVERVMTEKPRKREARG
jgi:hypothetical protein